MSSDQFLLGYALSDGRDHEALAARIRNTDALARELAALPLRRIEFGDHRLGLVAWEPGGGLGPWPTLRRDAERATGSLHGLRSTSPEHQDLEHPELVHALFDGQVDPASLAAPYAAFRCDRDRLEVMNDLLGAVRLYHFYGPSGDVWTSRMDLAHVFLGRDPRPDPLAWAGMATIGWAPAGRTQLAGGRHLPGGIHVQVRRRLLRHIVEERSYFDAWFDTARGAEEPSVESQVRDVRSVITVAGTWPQPPVADLSGGKDSRVIAALGISAGTVATVRTVATDEGEVATARRLVACSPRPVEHRIVAKGGASRPAIRNLETLLVSQHHAWNGRFMAASAQGATFAGFRPARRASLNGLGGEAVAGGALWAGPWRDRLMSAPPEAALDRIAALVKNGRGVAGASQERTLDWYTDYVGQAADLGPATAGGVLDLLYLRDRVPHWSNTFASSANLVPLLAPRLLVVAARSVGRPLGDGSFHRRIVRAAVPAWDKVPYYKPAGAARRMTPFLWQDEGWPDLRTFLSDRLERTYSFDRGAVATALDDPSGAGNEKSVETMLHRLAFELSFEQYLVELRSRARRTADELGLAWNELSSGRSIAWRRKRRRGRTRQDA